MSDDQWYYQAMGAMVGPFSFEDLSRQVNEGHVTANTLVRQGRNGIWVSASRVEGLFGGMAVTQVFTPPPDFNTRQFSETAPLPPATLPPIHHLPTTRDVRKAHRKPHSSPLSLPGWLLGLLGVVAVLSVVVFVKVATAPPAKRAAEQTQSGEPQTPTEYADLVQQADSLIASTAKAMESIVPELTVELRAIAAKPATDPDETARKQRGAVVEYQKKVYAAAAELRLLSREIKDLLDQHPGNATLKQIVRKLDDQREHCDALANHLPEVR